MPENEFLTDRAIDQEVRGLNEILRQAESSASFCTTHELVDRNCITSKKKDA